MLQQRQAVPDQPPDGIVPEASGFVRRLWLVYLLFTDRDALYCHRLTYRYLIRGSMNA